jgi:Mg/Co/Ni transporter MgtE
LLSVPVIDANDRLLGAVTVDDVLDHLLPENWRHDHRETARTQVDIAQLEKEGV